MTLIVPLLFLLGIIVMHMASGLQNPPEAGTVRLGYVDEAGGFIRNTTQGGIGMGRYDTTGAALNAMNKGDIEEYFVIPKDYISGAAINLYSLKKQLQAPASIQTAINHFLTDNLLAELPQATIERVKSPAPIVPITLTASGAAAPEQGGLLNFLVPGVFSILFALSMVFSSVYMLQGLGEEKENRVMEVLLSSVSARQLLTGKVLGLSAAGLIQVAVWVVSLPFLLKLAASYAGGFAGAIQLPAGFLTLGAVFFILGYLLFAVLAAGVGAVSPSTQEGQQLSSVYTLFALIPVWFMSLNIAFPDHPIWTVLTVFPLTAPVMVMERLGMTSVPPWEIAVSIAVLILSIIGGLYLASKIFRIHLLSYGKRVGLREIFRG